MSSHQVPLATLFCLLSLVCEQSSGGKLFEWVDSNGTTHFSDRAPAGLPFAEKTARPASGPARPDHETGIREAEHALLKKARSQDSKIERAKQAAALQAEQRKSRCMRARARYQEAIHQPRSAGGGDYKKHRRKMKEVCD